MCVRANRKVRHPRAPGILHATIEYSVVTGQEVARKRRAHARGASERTRDLVRDRWQTLDELRAHRKQGAQKGRMLQWQTVAAHSSARSVALHVSASCAMCGRSSTGRALPGSTTHRRNLQLRQGPKELAAHTQCSVGECRAVQIWQLRFARGNLGSS